MKIGMECKNCWWYGQICCDECGGEGGDHHFFHPAITVCVAGAFDPLHLGHLRHIQEARKLGVCLIVLMSNDQDMINKKGYCFMPLEQRVEIIKELRSVDEVVVTIDEDGTQAKTLKMVRPDIFAKGGDRGPSSMPLNEIEACKEIGCKIVYGVGERLASSSDLVKEACFYLND